MTADKRYVDTSCLASLRSYVFGLAMECPVGGNPADCPLHDIRKLPVEERFAWVNALDHQQCMDIFNHHCTCYENKTGR